MEPGQGVLGGRVIALPENWGLFVHFKEEVIIKQLGTPISGFTHKFGLKFRQKDMRILGFVSLKLS
jgi:hypothetical protein